MTILRKLALALAFTLVGASAFAGGATETVSPKGQWLAGKLDSMGVETKWIAGQHIDWRTGLPDGQTEQAEGRHTHCSAFVAATAKTLGVHILRPPEHPQMLLANAQFHWLEEAGAAEGWRSVPDPVSAQAAANAGDLVVASYLSHRESSPGHIAIVKPARRSVAEIESEGPLVIQAGTTNSAAISLSEGFAGHPHAWGGHEVTFYAHAIRE